MIRRILFITAAAATLLGAAPAFAAENPKHDACSCCSDGSMHQTDHKLREQNASKDSSLAAQPTQSDDPNIRNQSFGG
jgi:hypothetical protein